MEEEEDMSPFWLQTTDRRRNLRRQASSIFLHSGVILIILLVIAFVFVFIIVPSFVSFTSQIFKPNLIKKSWDSLNLVLVLFAIVCGFLSKNNNNNSNNESTNYQSISNVQQHGDVQRSYPSTPARRWNDHDHDHQYQNRTAFNTLTRLRSFSSYPDLRQESFWVNNDERWRFYDDTHIKSSSDQLQHYRPLPQQENEETKNQLEEVEDVGSKDKEVVYTPPPPPAPPLAPPLSPQLLPSKAMRRKVKRTYQDLGHEKRREEEKDLDDEKFYVPPPSPPPAPPLPTQLPPPKAVRRKVKRNYQDLEHEKRKEEEKNLEEKKFYIPPPPPLPPPPPIFSKNEKKRGKDLLTALRRKKKKQRQKSVENLESLFNPEPSTLSFIPPPSPPPPPPPHFFQNLFSSNKKGKSKNTHSAPPPPPPPPPPVKNSSSRTHVQSRASRTTAQVAEVTTHQPPKAVKTTANNFSRVEENVESGNASPVIPIPPPPPPPFKMRSWKFARDGDYVRVASFNSSRSGSPDLDGEEPSDKESISPMAGKEGGDSSSSMPLFCPSPDVNTKAENFIARFRAGLKLEKINSVKGRSNLGPGPHTVEKEGPN